MYLTDPVCCVIRPSASICSDCANEATYVQTITVEHTTPPVFEGPLPTEATFECMAEPPATLSATDNCGQAVVTFVEGKTDGDCPYDYLLTPTWTATEKVFSAHCADCIVSENYS